MSNVISNFYAFKFLRLLTQEWKSTDAYEQGVIDQNGELIKQPKSHEEKQAYSRFNRLAFNIRRMIEKIPMGKSSIARYATAVALLKDSVEHPDKLEETFLNYLSEQGIKFPRIIQLVKEDVSEYTDVFGIYFKEDSEGNLQLVDEDMSAVPPAGTSTGGIDMGVHKKKPVEEDNGDCSFAGNAVFNCDDDTFQNCRHGKKKYLKYKPFVGEDEVGERIRLYGRNNPKKGIVLKNARSGAMIYLRRGQE